MLDATVRKPYADPLVPLPVLNVGMPKSGSTTLHRYYTCKGLNSTHWTDNTPGGFEGLCMRDAVRAGLPPLETCSHHAQALMQMDVAFPFGHRNQRYGTSEHHSVSSRDDCFFPQLSVLEELHAENEDATFVLTFRPVRDWVNSMVNWYELMERLRKCHLPNLPRGIPDLSSSSPGGNNGSGNNNRNNKNNKDVRAVMAHFFCSHVNHVRSFVAKHPSHTLLELDLYDPNTPVLLDKLFPSKPSNHHGKEDEEDERDESCWKHSNISRPKNGTSGRRRRKREKRAKQRRGRGGEPKPPGLPEKITSADGII